MQLKTVQWNIGGGIIRGLESDPTKDKSYDQENLSYVIEKLSAYKPDVITLQEVHEDDAENQAQVISEKLGLPFFVSDVYNQSHLNETKKFNQAIISRFPLREHSFEFFFNPMYRKIMDDGSEWISHEKGVSTCVADIQGQGLVIQTLHLIPFGKFGADVDDESGMRVRTSIENLLEKDKTPYLIQGDFNYPDIKKLLPHVYERELHEAGGATATTPNGKIYDHVLFRGLVQDSHPLIDSGVLTDHYPIVSSFEL